MLTGSVLRKLAAVMLASTLPSPASADSGLDAAINRIADEGFSHSDVERIVRHLTDDIGSRLTNSPGKRQAEQWTAAQFTSWGLASVHQEAVPFGRGWSMDSSQVRMIAPRPLQLKTIPVAWTPGTDGIITAPIVVAPLQRPADLVLWHGRLAGRIVLISPPGTVAEITRPLFQRWTTEELAKLGEFQPPPPTGAAERERIATTDFEAGLDDYLKAEGALAWVKMSREDYMAIHGEGDGYLAGRTPKLPAVEMAAEDYRRLTRLAAAGAPPTLSIGTTVHYEDGDPNTYNILADIAGTDRRAGYIMVGAHLDSWHAADGAMDDGAGIAIEMEAARILAKLGIRPKRTIRFALFAAEEQGLVGSRAYVAQHIASRPIAYRADLNGSQQSAGESSSWPITPKPGYGDIKAYFNLDLGSGRIRGVTAPGDVMALAKLRQWILPFAKMGVTGSSAGNSGGGADYSSFLAMGIPAVSFTPDLRDILSLHHTDSDTFDHLSMEDLRNNAVIVAGLLLEAADDDTTLPPIPMPRPVENGAP